MVPLFVSQEHERNMESSPPFRQAGDVVTGIIAVA